MGCEKRLWRRVAVSLMIVGGILVMGKWIPLPGIGANEFAGFIELCSGKRPFAFIGWMFSCPEPMLPHRELGGSALLGVAAIVTFFALWVRRWLAH